MSSRRSALLAEPAWRIVPAAASSAGPEAVELAASAGLVLDPWQEAAVSDLLGEDEEGYWSATSGGLVCPRQNGKGSIIEALELAWLFLFGVDLIFHSAHLFSTSADAYRRIKFLIQNTPDLHRQVLRYTEAHGQEGIELRSGQRLRFVTRSKSGGRGFPAPAVVLDEAFNLSAQAVAALVPTMAAQSNPFLLLTSSAPIQDPCSDVLRNFMRRSRSGEVERRCYIEYSAKPGDDYETQLQEANPGYGVRLNDDVIDEERELLTTEAFEIERLGIVDLEGTGSHVIPLEKWLACSDPGSSPVGLPVFAVDSTPDKAWTSIAAAGHRSDGLPHAEVIDHRAGTSWAAPRLLEITQKWGRVRIVGDLSGPAGSIAAEAKALGVEVEAVGTREYAQSCGLILDLASEERFRHRTEPVLDAALAGAVKLDVGDGAWKWSRKNSLVDISPLVAVTLALGAIGAPAPTPGFKSLDDYLDEDD